MSRRAWRERRRRVDALHHAEGLAAESGASFAAAESQAVFSLGSQVCEAFRRRRRRPSEFDMLRAVEMAALGSGFELVDHAEETHSTPWGATQAFTYALCRRSPPET